MPDDRQDRRRGVTGIVMLGSAAPAAPSVEPRPEEPTQPEEPGEAFSYAIPLPPPPSMADRYPPEEPAQNYKIEPPPRVTPDPDPPREGPDPPPVPERYLLPILYLAEQMALADGVLSGEERTLIDALAVAAELPRFREDPWYRSLSEDLACAMLRGEFLQKATLVTLSLVLKADAKRLPEEHQFFTRIRLKLEAEPVTVPINLDRHRQAAVNYFHTLRGTV